jgi:adenosine/AMP kinase
MELAAIRIESPDDLNVNIGQAHIIKTLEDLHEALAGSSSTYVSGSRSARRPRSAWRGRA